jgi:lysophospholipase L1-like esterase
MRPAFPPALLAAAALALIGPRVASADAMQTYLAVGDSLAFGFTDSPAPSLGDRGYVGDYADALAARDGVRPNVVNLGTYGETTSTFFSGGNPSASWNQNYANDTTSQNSLMLSTIAAQKAAGHDIGTVSVQLGANDLFAAAQAPGFFNLSPAAQQAAVQQVLAAVANNVGTVLGEIRSQLPNADLIVMGYYNPYAAVPNNPFSAVAGPAIQGLDAVLQADAKAFGARYIDTYTPFLGKEAEDTFITTSGTTYNVHPTDAGYALIAAQMQPVPEPSTLAVLAAGAFGLFVADRRRRRAAS